MCRTLPISAWGSALLPYAFPQQLDEVLRLRRPQTGFRATEDGHRSPYADLIQLVAFLASWLDGFVRMALVMR